MKLAIIGASAGIGLAMVRQALEKGHEVTAFSRDTSAIPAHPLLTKINGNATSSENLKNAISTADAVIVTIGTKNKKATRLFSQTALALIRATDELEFTAPVLVITGFGSGESSRYTSFFMRTVIRLFLKDQYEDKTRMEEFLVQSNLKWEIVRPGMLTNGPLTGTYKVIGELSKGMKVGKISRSDVAEFLLQEAEHPALLYRFPALTN